MIKWLFILFFMLGFLLGYYLLAEKGSREGNRVTVSILLDLQGGQKTLGEATLKGLQLALKELPPEINSKLNVSIVDTKTNLAFTKEIGKKTASTSFLGAGFTNNDSVLAVGHDYEVNEVPFLAIGATDPKLPLEFDGYVFLLPFGDNAQAAAAAEFAIKKFGKTAYILWDNTSEYTQSLPHYFDKRFKELGGEVVGESSYNGGCDISFIGKDIPHVDFIYLAALPNCVGELISSLRSSGIKTPIIGGDGLDSSNLYGRDAPKVNQVWFTTHAWLGEKGATPETRAFIKAFQEQYQQPPISAFSALGYDAGHLIGQLVRKAKSGLPSDILQALEDTNNFKGVTGTISYSKKNRVPNKTVWIIELDRGNRSLADHFIPDKIPPAML